MTVNSGENDTQYMTEKVRPDYYRYTIKNVEFDVLDIARAMQLPNTLMLALKYFRVKGDNAKRINDLEKAIECIRREIEFIESEG